jgi:hypothetical protein
MPDTLTEMGDNGRIGVRERSPTVPGTGKAVREGGGDVWSFSNVNTVRKTLVPIPPTRRVPLIPRG